MSLLRFITRTLPLRGQNKLTMATSAMSTQPGPVESSIREKVAFLIIDRLSLMIRCQLNTLLNPTSLVIANDSWKHQHHAAMRAISGGNGETRE